MRTLLSGPARRACFVLVASLSWAAPLAAQSAVDAAVEAASPGIVNVSTFFPTGPDDVTRVQRPGSGVVLSADGLILTNLHLVAEIDVEGGTAKEGFYVEVTPSVWASYRAELVARDERLDLALLKVNSGAKRLESLPFAESHRARNGERAFAMSLASVRRHDIFAGVVAQPTGPVKLLENLLDPAEVILTDARFHDSLDGAPLIDARGRLLGIHNSSHVSAVPEDFKEPDEDEEPAPDLDYAVIVSSDAIRAAFGEHLDPTQEPAVKILEEPVQEAVEAIAVGSPSVVSVWTGAPDEHPARPEPSDPPARLGPESLASGVLLTADGKVITSARPFSEGAEQASVRLADGQVFTGHLLKRRPLHHTALLQLELPEGLALQPAQLLDPAEPMQGELVEVVGRPYSGITLSVGVLSSLEREGFVQVASWVHPGHYGGAVLDRFGRLMAIATPQPSSADRADEKSYLGFASPLGTVLADYADVLPGREALSLQRDDEARREERRAPAARVAELTRASMVNVLVSLAEEKEATGFDPFASDEKEFSLLGQGSGEIIDASGLALTNWHVVDAALADDGSQSEDSLVEVTLPDGRRYVADVLSTSRDDDLALISLRLAPGDVVEPVALGDSDALEVGQPVFAIGNPLGLANSISAGVVSSLDNDILIRGRLRKYHGMIQTDASINPGNSGGSLLDSKGRLVGINSAGRTGAGLAIPVNRAKEVFRGRLLSVEELRSIYLGFEVEEGPDGLVVSEVASDGPAERASMEVGDALTTFDGEPVTTAVAFARARLAHPTSERLTLGILRSGEPHELFLQPQSYSAWQLERQTGLELVEVDYDQERERVEEASRLLYRAYTGHEGGSPRQLMAGALTVENARSLDPGRQQPVLPGDWLLGVTLRTRQAGGDRYDLVRLESLADATRVLGPLATKEGTRVECWVLRDGRIQNEHLFLRRPPRPVTKSE